MTEKKIDFDGFKLRVCETDTLVIGSGCAGFNAADWLYDLGQKNIVLITEGINKGASRNTGSDKQTYYKLSIAAGEADSVDEMTETLCGAGVNGDTALAEAASSLQSFFKLVNLGVPFPTNEYGEFIGYKTDHDPRQRATSAGPLTSKMMTEALERSVNNKGIPVIDGMQAVKLFTDGKKLLGVLALDLTKFLKKDADFKAKESFVYFSCDNVILATGGPACVYHASVYPESQTGMTGMAIDAGSELCNFSEWQYGLASLKFRWNVSGTYQQVLPRYISVDKDGTEREFLNEYFDDPFHAVDMVFLKGYQWPFDVKKIDGSSQIDMIVHHETAVLGNRVFMDFTRNPTCIEKEGFSKLNEVTLAYLGNSEALLGAPIDRLIKMNMPAIELYRNNGIDITREPLEIAVCAQHCNGGLAVDSNWQTSIEGLYTAGEAAGTFGVHRPGGSALNSAQVGSMRAAHHIAHKNRNSSSVIVGNAKQSRNNSSLPKAEIKDFINSITVNQANGTAFDFREKQIYLQKEMSRCAAHIRDEESLITLEPAIRQELDSVFTRAYSDSELPELLKYRDMLLTQLALISAIKTAGKKFGSRGSSLIKKENGEAVSQRLSAYQYAPETESEINVALYTKKTPDGFTSWLSPVRPIPDRDTWFETVWADYNSMTR